MAGVRLEFAQFGHFDYFNIYRNPVSTDKESLGQPIGTSSTMYFDDFNAEPNLDYFYRVGVIRDSIEEFSEEIHVRTEVMFDPPYDLIVEFKNDEANSLELNWSLDGFVDEQRYYCSETPIEPDNLPVPKAVLAGDLRSHIDADIELGKKYHIVIGSVKKAVEKISEEIRVITNWPYYNANVISAMNFNGNFNDEKGLSWQNSGVQINTSDYKFAPSSAYFAANSHLRCFDHIFVFFSNAYTIDFFIKINATTVSNWPYIFASQHFSKPNGFLCYCDGAGLYGGSGVLTFAGTQGGPALTSTSIIRNSGWRHIEISSDGVTHRMFIDGNLESTSTTPYNFANPMAFLGAALNTASTGADLNTTENMFIDSFVITSGKALHTQNFVPRNRKFEI